MLQVIAENRRFDISTEPKIFEREARREFAELLRVIDDLYEDLGRANAITDEAFEHDVLWPPGTFWERRATGRLAARLPYAHAEPDADLLAEFPRGHFYRRIVRASVSFATYLSAMPPPSAVARLHGAWTRGLLALPEGETELERFLIERIEMHGGRCLLDGRAENVVSKRGVVCGVTIDGDEHPTGAEFVIADIDGESLAGLAGGHGIHKRALREWPRITSTVGRFVTSIVVGTAGLPTPLGTEALVFPKAANRGQRPLHIHLQRKDRADGRSLLTAEVLLRDHGALPLEKARAFVIGELAKELPYLEQHLVVVDSPHDGLPVWAYDNGKRHDVDRLGLGLLRTEPMQRQLEVDPPGYLGLGGEPIRGPIDRSLLVGRSVLPGLGQEGELLAAWGAARLVTRSDSKKALMRRDLWTKSEFG